VAGAGGCAMTLRQRPNGYPALDAV